jgi:peptidoglycan/xylan/chitin deacetylase (PgdA/CDA1 family)
MGGEGTLVVSLDFELNWGVRDQVSLDRYGANLRGAREVIPRLLERFEAHGVRATWATVGMLFCESKEELLARAPERRPAYAHQELSPYPHIASIGADERTDPLHFAPSLVRRIAAAEGQEVATHTFSHFYCLEPGQTEADFEADLHAAVDVARAAGVELSSIVFPRNQVNPAYLPVCARLGLIAYRGNPTGRVYSPRSEASDTPFRRAARLLDSYAPLYRNGGGLPETPAPEQLVDVRATRFLRPRPRSGVLARLEPRKVARVLGEMVRAASAGAVYHLWWHPHNFGVDQDLHLAQLDALLGRFVRLREEGAMRSLTMAELAREQRAA